MVSRFLQTRESEGRQDEKRQAMQLLTGEVNAAVDGILDAYAQAEIIVWDAHGSGGIDVMSFHPGAKLISRGPISPPYHLDSSFQGTANRRP